MRVIRIAVCSLALLGCRKEDQTVRPDSIGARGPDSVVLAVYADSVLDNPSREFTIMPNGDTLRSQGGMMMDKEVAPNYGIEHYTVNSTHYVRVTEAVGRTASGNPINKTRVRILLPPVDSTEDVSIWGLCSVNGVNDPLVVGIMRPLGDSAEWQASHAWRLDLKAGAAHEIPVTGVKCGAIGGDD